MSRNWRSPVAEVDFRTNAVEAVAGKTQVEPETIHGTGGVVITSESRSGNAAAVPAKMTADEVTGTFGAGSALRTLVGTGHAEMDQTTATGAQQTALTATDWEQVRAACWNAKQSYKQRSNLGDRGGAATTGAPDVQSAELDGHVVLFEQPAAKPGAAAATAAARHGRQGGVRGRGRVAAPDHSAAHREWRPGTDGGQGGCIAAIGRGFAHGNVKATWTAARFARQSRAVANRPVRETQAGQVRAA